MNHQQTRQEKNFAIFIFATRSRYLTTPPTISCMETVTLSEYFNVKTTVRSYQSVSVAVGEELPCQRKGANSEDLFAVVVMTASYRRSQKISAVCSMYSMQGTILSMLDGSRTNFLSIYWICGSNTLCLASSARQQEIFGGRNFRGNKFSRAGV